MLRAAGIDVSRVTRRSRHQDRRHGVAHLGRTRPRARLLPRLDRRARRRRDRRRRLPRLRSPARVVVLPAAEAAARRAPRSSRARGPPACPRRSIPGFDPSETWGADLKRDAARGRPVLSERGRAARRSPGPTTSCAGLARWRTAARAPSRSSGRAARPPSWTARWSRCAAFPVEPVDTTGAGDSFDAGFLYAWLAGRAAARSACAGAPPAAASPPAARAAPATRPTARRWSACCPAAVITVGGFNTSIDKTMEMAELRGGGGEPRRPPSSPTPGGKGLHVARAIGTLGEPATPGRASSTPRTGRSSTTRWPRRRRLRGDRGRRRAHVSRPSARAAGTRVTEILEPGPVVDDGGAARGVRRLPRPGAAARTWRCSRAACRAASTRTSTRGWRAALREAGVRCLRGRQRSAAAGGGGGAAVPREAEPRGAGGAARRVDRRRGRRRRRRPRACARAGIAMVVVSLGAEGAVLAADGPRLPRRRPAAARGEHGGLGRLPAGGDRGRAGPRPARGRGAAPRRRLRHRQHAERRSTGT